MEITNKNAITLLLTACIHPNYDGNNPDFYNIREKQYEDALKYYIYNSKFTHIIFIDNSNYILRYIKNLKPQENNLYNVNCKIIEYISFDGNKLTKKYQYGYGEQEIMDYAFDHSIVLKNLRNDESLFKITGRYIIKNINHLIDTSPKELFFRGIWGFSCVTAIFKIKKGNFIKLLYGKIREFYVNYSNGRFITLESTYYIHLKNYIYETVKIKGPIFIFRYLNDGTIRHGLPIKNMVLVKFIYSCFSILMLNQFGFISRIIDYCFFNTWYKNKFLLYNN